VLGLCLNLTGCASSGGPGAAAPPPSPGSGAQAPETIVTVTPQSEWAEAILYFVILDRFADGDPGNDFDVTRNAPGTFHGGDLVGLTEHLDELAGLGVTALWITPVVENIPGFVTGAGFPDWGYHGYWADDFYQVDRRFGTEDELHALVEAAHARGMAVLLDVVYNHAGYDSQYLTNPKTRGWLRSEDAGTCGHDDLTSCVAGLPDFKTELPEVADYLMEAHLARAERVGLDGFRLDTVKHVDHPFWREHRRRTRARLGEGFFLLGEVWGGDPDVLDAWFADDEMDAGFDFSFQGSTIAFVDRRGRPVAFNRYLERRHRVRDGYLLAHYLSSHDVPGALFQLGGDVARFRLAALLQMTTAGIPTVYYGEEVGRPGGDWPANRSDMPWGERDILPGAGEPRNEALREDYKKLIALRRSQPALWRGGHTALAAGDDWLAFARRDPLTGETVVVAVNRAEEPATADFEAPPGWAGAAVEDLWSGEAVEVTEGRISVTVPGLWGRILAVKAAEGSSTAEPASVLGTGGGSLRNPPSIPPLIKGGKLGLTFCHRFCNWVGGGAPPLVKGGVGGGFSRGAHPWPR
jgi:alpha-amylase